MPELKEEKITLDFSNPQIICLKLTGNWQISGAIPSVDDVLARIYTQAGIRQVTFDISGLKGWDSSLVSFLLVLSKECANRDIAVDQDALAEGLRKILAVAAKLEKEDIVPPVSGESFLERAGNIFLQVKDSGIALLEFLGEIAVAFSRLFSGRAFFRRDDFYLIVQRCGASALGLVSLISMLVGIIFAFIGVIQLRLFGAQIYIADIVGIATVRVMGAVMTGIIMSGRTGAAFAAELGIMQVNEEIDSLKTLGVSAVEFLVMPRILAMVIMMPLLTLYSDLMGILGGYLISTGVLGINPVEYINHTYSAVRLSNLWVGLSHSLVFGVIIAVAGCFRGLRCERSASGVGEAATSAVVTAITSIVIATAIITFICQVLRI